VGFQEDPSGCRFPFSTQNLGHPIGIFARIRLNALGMFEDAKKKPHWLRKRDVPSMVKLMRADVPTLGWTQEELK